MNKKILFIIFILQVSVSCGFTPVLKMSDENQFSSKIYYQIEESSYLARQAFTTLLKNIDTNEYKYLAKINVSESESAVNIQPNGSVVEYRVEVLIKYKLLENNTGKLVLESQARGFANYDVSSSEYTNSLVKNEALKTSINEAAQLMNIMLQSKISG